MTGIRPAFPDVCLGRQLEGCARVVAGKYEGNLLMVADLCGRAVPDSGEPMSALLGVGILNSEDDRKNEV